MLRPTAVALLAFVFACSPELSVPDNVLVSCAQGQCPDGYHCNNAQLCVPSTSDDSIAPTLSNAAYDQRAVGVGKTINLTFTASERLLIDPIVTFASGSIVQKMTRASVVEGDSPQYVFTYTATGEENEDTAAVSASLIDLVGNANNVSLPAVVFDFTPPAILSGSALLELTPDRATNPLDTVSAITHGTRVRLSFATQEPLTSAPMLTFGEVSLAATKISSTVFAFDEVWSTSTAIPDGAHVVTATLVDDALNSTTVTLELTTSITPRGFVVDTIAPLPPDVASLSSITVQRRPWGMFGTDATGTYVVGGAGSAEAGAHVLAYGVARNPYCAPGGCRFASTSLGATSVDGGGAFELNIGLGDRERVYIAVVDDAGNTSGATSDALQASGVINVELAVSFQQPSGENPNTYAIADQFPPVLGNVVTTTIDPGMIAALDDAKAASTKGAFAYTLHANNAQALSVATEAWATTIPTTGRVLSHLYNYRGINAIDSVNLVRDADGLRTVASKSGISLSAAYPMAYSVANDAALVVIEGATWLWNGDTWRQVCLSEACAANQPDRGDFVLVADPNRRVVTMIGGSTGGGGDDPSYVWEWDGDHWTNSCPAGCGTPNIGNKAAAFFDPKLNAIAVLPSIGPASMYTWNGAAWTKICASCTLPSPRDGAAVAYDVDRGEAVLFGGASTPAACFIATAVLNDTWIWNGTSWIQRAPAVSPPAQRDAALAFDPIRRRMVKIGGQVPNCATSPQGLSNNLWEWDGVTWLQVSPVATAPTRSAYDPVSKRVVAIATIDGTLTTVRWSGFEWLATGIAAPPLATDATYVMNTSSFASIGRTFLISDAGSYTLEASSWVARCTGTACGLGATPTSMDFVTDGIGLVAIDGTSLKRFVNTGWTLTLCATCSTSSASFSSFAYGETPGMFYWLKGTLERFNGSGFENVAPSVIGDIRGTSSFYDIGRRAFARFGGGTPGSHGSFNYNNPTIVYAINGVWSAPALSTRSVAQPQVFFEDVVFDRGRNEAFLRGSITYAGALDRPAHIITLPFGEHIDSAANLGAIDLDWYGTATSDSGGTLSDAVTVWAWDVDKWTSVNAERVDGSHWRAHIVGATFRTGGSLARLPVGSDRTVTIAVTPAGINGGLAGNAVLTGDGAAGRVVYRLEP